MRPSSIRKRGSASRGFIDEAIMPSHTRKYLIDAFAMLEHQEDKLPEKKHGNISLWKKCYRNSTIIEAY